MWGASSHPGPSGPAPRFVCRGTRSALLWKSAIVRLGPGGVEVIHDEDGVLGNEREFLKGVSRAGPVGWEVRSTEGRGRNAPEPARQAGICGYRFPSMKIEKFASTELARGARKVTASAGTQRAEELRPTSAGSP